MIIKDRVIFVNLEICRVKLYTRFMKKKDDSKITKILDSAVTIILTEGVAALSTTKIAKMMGIAQSNIYLYFKNKDDLLKNIYHREFERIRQISDLEKLNDRTILVNERIDYYIHSVFDYAIAYPNSLTVIEQIKSLNILEDDIYSGNEQVIQLLNEGIQKGYLKDVPINLHMVTVFNILHRHALNINQGLYSKQKYSYQIISKMILDSICQ